MVRIKNPKEIIKSPQKRKKEKKKKTKGIGNIFVQSLC
jgi:hypothetical protein